MSGMRWRPNLLLCVGLALALGSARIIGQDEGRPVYRDPQAPIEARVNDLLKRMTLEEKIAQLSGDPSGMSTPTNERLGIPGFLMADGPHGVRRGKATCFPCSLALGASWDPALVERVGTALGREFRGKGRYVALAPCINIIRDPRGGRSFETMGEDPYLIARLAAAYVKGVQSQKVIAVPKHYACNNQENNRGANDVQVDERTLREVYLPGFKACVQQGEAWGIMAAYNKVRGAHCTANRHLLTDILKDDWGFEGFVVSDWGACHATVESINAGMDLEMPQTHYYGQPLRDAVKNGEVSEQAIDDAARRVLRAKFWAGVFEQPVEPDESVVNSPEHQALALEAAQKAIVLLKNEGGLLPLVQQRIKSLAVIGPSANVPRPTGGGSSHTTPYYAVTPLEGLKNRAGDDIGIQFVKGCDMEFEYDLLPVETAFLRPPEAQPEEQGLLGEYFNNTELKGEPVLNRLDAAIDFDWHGGSPDNGVNQDEFSVRWQGKLLPDKTGEYALGTTTDDGVRLYLDGKLLIDDWHDHGAKTNMVMVPLQAGREYNIRVEYYENRGDAIVKLGWAQPGAAEDPFREARQAARQADAAIVVVGTSARQESEGHDRPHLKLAAPQDDLIAAVAEANKNTVVLLVNGSAVLMNDWIDRVPAVLECWFGGQEAGNAIADVLFGHCSPGGKLPVTFPRTEDQLPPFDNSYETVGEGRGYRYYDQQGLEPLFCFGYGLSYTQFRYGDLEVSPLEASTNEQVRVTVEVTNVGKVAGDEVVQLYVRDLVASVEMPLAELKGFQRIHLAPGETKTVEFTLRAADLAFYDVDAQRFVAEPGNFEVRVGSSSRDIRRKATFTLR